MKSSLLRSGVPWCVLKIRSFPTRCLERRWLSSGTIIDPVPVGSAPPSPIRNVGIMAHIDAGKTTTTERMLFYAGFTRHMGDVDDGDTVMDYMQQERERGITINSAAISFDWLKHRINLIDTPGHVDFTFEVERSLRVLDGAVAVFDGSAGVEVQSVTVWRQADQYSIPRVVFVNKMDKPGASLSLTLESMKQKLNATPLVTQLPLGHGKEFRGVIDLLSLDALIWERGTDGSEFKCVPLLPMDAETGEKDFACVPSLLGPSWNCGSDLPLSREEVKEALAQRSLLAEQVISMDDQLIEKISDDSFDPLTLTHEELMGGVRRLTVGCLATPIMCGSSLQNAAVQPLMDAIVTYLPGPAERAIQISQSLKELYAYAFKVTHDKRRGPMVYLRIYSGKVVAHSSVYNLSRQANEKVSRVLLMLADEQREVGSMEEGNIAVVVGMKNTFTGDTIVKSASAAKSAERSLQRDDHSGTGNGKPVATLALESIEVPPPVFFCSVEPYSAAIQADLDHALSCLSREDPSLRVSVDPETGQTVLSGMGELHLEIIHDRLKRDFGVNCSLGKLQVSYKERPTVSASQKVAVDRTVGSKHQMVSLMLDVTPTGSESSHGKPSVHLDLASQRHEAQLPGGYSKAELLEAVKEGVEAGCLQGPVLGFPVLYVNVRVSELSLGPTTSLATLASCTSEGVASALRRAKVQLLEPCMQLHLTVPEDHMGRVLSDLTSQRRAQIEDVGCGHGTDKAITAITPLSCLMGYSTVLRTMTSGTGSFVASFSRYEPVSTEQEKVVMQEMRGY